MKPCIDKMYFCKHLIQHIDMEQNKMEIIDGTYIFFVSFFLVSLDFRCFLSLQHSCTPLHDALRAGHLRVARTYDRLCNRFYWPGLLHSVLCYVKACEVYQCRKKPSVLSAGCFQPIDVSLEPFFRVILDLLGPFPTSAAGNK